MTVLNMEWQLLSSQCVASKIIQQFIWMISLHVLLALLPKNVILISVTSVNLMVAFLSTTA